MNPQMGDAQGGQPAPAPSPDQGAPGAPASSAQADPNLMALAKLISVTQQMAQQNAVIAPMMAKAAQAFQEAQAAIMTGPAPQPQASTPPY